MDYDRQINIQFYNACKARDIELAKQIARDNPDLGIPFSAIVSTARNVGVTEIAIIVAKETPGVVLFGSFFLEYMTMIIIHNSNYDPTKDEFMNLCIKDNNLVLFGVDEAVSTFLYFELYQLLERVYELYSPSFVMTELRFLRIIISKNRKFVETVLRLFPDKCYLKTSILRESINIIISTQALYDKDYKLFLLERIIEYIDLLEEDSSLGSLRFYKNYHWAGESPEYDIFKELMSLSELDKESPFIVTKFLNMFRERYPERFTYTSKTANNDWVRKNYPNAIEN